MNNIPLASSINHIYKFENFDYYLFFYLKNIISFMKSILFYYFLNTLQLKRGLSFNILILAYFSSNL